MLVILKSNGGYTFEGVEGKKVVAEPSRSGCEIRISELYRTCTNDPYARSEGLSIDADCTFYFHDRDFEVVQPKLQNCSDSNVGKGWEGYYEQKPVKRSKFRV